MKKVFVKFTIIGAVCSLSIAAFAQANSQDNMNSGSDSTSEGSSRISHSSKDQLSSTGRNSQQAVRGSKLMGAEIQDSSGQRIGRIEDVIINPSLGKIDFAVISRSNMGGASSPSGSSSGTSYGSTSDSQSQSSESSTTSSESSSSSSSRGKLIPIPWALLQPSSSSSSSPSSSSSLYAQQTFTLNVDQTKLDQAPSISRGNWSEITQSNWRDRINSYFGQSSTGGAESPSGTEKGSGSGR